MARPTWMSSIQWEIESLHTASTASTFESFPLGLGGRSPSEEEQQSRIQRWRVEVLAASPSLGREAGRQERVVTTGKLKIDFISSNPPSDLTSSDTTSTQPARKPLDALQTASAQHLDTTMAESPGSPKRPTSAISVISDDNEGNEPPRKKAKLDDATHKTNGNMTASTYRMPAANLPAPKHANLLHPPATSAYAMPAPNKVDLRAHVPNGQGPPVISPAINDEGWVEDTMTVGLHYLDQIRNNPQLRIDETLRKLLLDPLPAESKPFKVCDPHNIPPKLYEYFYILTFHTNKVLAVPCILLDLFLKCDIYISFRAVCAIQEKLFRDGKTGFGWVDGVPMFRQSEQVKHYVLGLMSSTKMVEAWSKTPAGITHRRNMELAVEGKVSEGDNPADKLLKRCDYPSWKDALDFKRGVWISVVNMRFQ